jgi:hypothetical protein
LPAGFLLTTEEFMNSSRLPFPKPAAVLLFLWFAFVWCFSFCCAFFAAGRCTRQRHFNKKVSVIFIEIIEEEYHSSPPPSSPPPSDPPSSKPPSNPPANPPASKPAKLSMDALPSAESCPPSPCPPPSYPTNIQPNRLFPESPKIGAKTIDDTPKAAVDFRFRNRLPPCRYTRNV